MAFDPITAVLTLGSTLIDRLLPDKTAAAAAKATLLEMQVKGEFDEALGQMQTNSVEAASSSVFVAGWRPFVGWCCGGAFAYAFIFQPLAQFILVAFHSNFDATKLPNLNLEEMMPVLLGMLGLGAMRSYDKTNGNSNGH